MPPTPKEIYNDIISDGKVTAAEARAYIRAGGQSIRLTAEKGFSLTWSALSYLGLTDDRQATRGPQTDEAPDIDIMALLPNSLKILAGLTAGGAYFLLDLTRDPVGTLLEPVTQIISDYLVVPIGGAIFGGLEALTAFLSWMFYGTDFAVGIEPGSVPGILDIPFLISGPVAGATGTVFTVITDAIGGANQTIARELIIPEFGVSAPALVTGFWVLEFMLMGWLAWIALRSIDIPFINVSGTLLAVSKPFRNIIDRWF